MAVLAKDGYLAVFAMELVLLAYSPLQLEDYRTGGINDVDIVETGCLIGLRRLAMGAEQYFGMMQMGIIGMANGLQSHLMQ